MVPASFPAALSRWLILLQETGFDANVPPFLLSSQPRNSKDYLAKKLVPGQNFRAARCQSGPDSGERSDIAGLFQAGTSAAGRTIYLTGRVRLWYDESRFTEDGSLCQAEESSSENR